MDICPALIWKGNTTMRRLFPLHIILTAVLFSVILNTSMEAHAAAGIIALPDAESADDTARHLRIIGTSDLHGKFFPWDYALNQENNSGSVVQLSTAVKKYRNGNTILVDAGDTIQGNFADIFARADESVHPMIQALNAIGYDVWVTGNHEYDYKMDIIKDTIADLDATTLTGNVYDETGRPLADGYTILNKNGIRVALIGMVTQNIVKWNPRNLQNCTVTDPLDETRRIIDKIEGQYDVLIGVFHLGLENELTVPNSGVTDICNACPEFDVMISSHEHKLVPGTLINGVLVVQNKDAAQTMSVVDLTLEPDKDGWKVMDKTSESIQIADYAPDPSLTEMLAPYDEAAKKDAETPIGMLEGGPLAPENETPGIPSAQIEDTALMDLLNSVMLYYSDAEVSAAPFTVMDADLQPGTIRKCDTSQIFKYSNTLYKLHMTGAQLKKYMEWSANYYNTFQPGDQTISFNPDFAEYNYDMFSGINYEINIANEPGSRIENLTWPDGTPVEDDDEFDIAVNSYRANSHLLEAGDIYSEGDDLPQLVDMDIRSDIGGIREQIRDYIVNVEGGTITPEVDHNWKITGIE